jgi:hypothetical protein
MQIPSVRVRATEPPPGWTDISTELTPPPIGSASGSTFTQWGALRSSANGETFLAGCVATPIPGWVDDMRPTVDYRTVSLMNAAAARIVGVPVESRDATGHFSLRPVGAPEDAPRVGIARTFVGWDEHAVITCFAICATGRVDPRAAPGDDAALPRGCDATVLTARLDGSGPPPRPGVVLGAVTWAVHHPSPTVLWGGVLAFAAGTLAVALRRRQRSRI